MVMMMKTTRERHAESAGVEEDGDGDGEEAEDRGGGDYCREVSSRRSRGGGGGEAAAEEEEEEEAMAHQQRHLYREIAGDLERAQEEQQEEFRLVSSQMEHEGKIPRRFTNLGQGARRDESPPLEWYGVPEGAQSLALIVQDPDAPDPQHPLVPWTHWVLINIPPTLKGIPANFSSKDVDEKSEYASIQEGINDWKIPGYRGPHPPVGVHRYEFKLYALDTTLKLGHKVTKDKALEAMDGHILGVAELVAHYGREKSKLDSGYIPPGGPHPVGSGWPDVMKGQAQFR